MISNGEFIPIAYFISKREDDMKGKQLCDDRMVVSDIMWKEGFKFVYMDKSSSTIIE